jgi:hypothetical protein
VCVCRVLCVVCVCLRCVCVCVCVFVSVVLRCGRVSVTFLNAVLELAVQV